MNILCTVAATRYGQVVEESYKSAHRSSFVPLSSDPWEIPKSSREIVKFQPLLSSLSRNRVVVTVVKKCSLL